QTLMSTLSRRRALLVLAASACGNGGSASSSGGPTSCFEIADGGAGKPYCLVEGRLVRVAGAKQIEVGAAALTNIDDNTAVIVARDAQGFHALSAICTHACCLVSLCKDASCAT